MTKFNRNILYTTLCLAALNGWSNDVWASAYKTEAITAAEYEQDTSGQVFKEYSAEEDGSLVAKYYRYKLDETKSYGETVTQTGSGSGDGSDAVVNVGLGENNTVADVKISDKLYEGNTYKYTYTGTVAEGDKAPTISVRGGAVYNEGGIEELKADFAGNKLESATAGENDVRTQGAAVTNRGTIVNLDGDFIDNKVDGFLAEGGALFNDKNSNIQTLTGDFVGNVGLGDNSSKGGAIFNSGEIGVVTGDFIANKIEATEQADGGAVDNIGGTIDNIQGNFNNNRVISQELSMSAGAFGGAVSNQDATILTLNGDFVGNQAEARVQAYGGALFNSGGVIDGVRGKFIGNKAVSENMSAAGGAIYNENASINRINSDFINNSAIGSNQALGGAIYSVLPEGDKVLELINSSFYSNSATSLNGEALGGAVYANRLSIRTDGADSVFRDNTANGADNAIYMDGEGLSQPAQLLMISGANSKIIFDDVIDGRNYDIEMHGDDKETGEIVFTTLVDNVENFKAMSCSAYHLGKDAVINTKNYIAGKDSYGQPVMKLDVEVDKANNTIHNGVINVAGDVIGTTDVIVNSLNSDELDSVDDAKTVFVSAPNDDVVNTESAFNVARVVNSPYMWKSIRNYGGETEGSTWYLAVKDLDDGAGGEGGGGNTGTGGGANGGQKKEYAPEIPAYIAMQAAAVEQNRGVSQKIGDALRAEQNRGCCDKKFKFKQNMWVHTDYDDAEIEAPVEMDANIKGVTAGLDVLAAGRNRIGLFGAYRQGDYELSGQGVREAKIGSKLDIDSYLGGVYYRYGTHHWAMLATLFGGKQDVNMKTDDNFVSADTSAWQYGASAELSRKFYLPYAFIIEPSLGLYYSVLDMDDFADAQTSMVDYDLMHYVEAELGLRVEHLFCMRGGTAKVYVKPSVIATYASGNKVKISSLKEDEETFDNKILGRMEVGAKFGITRSLSAYTSANYTFGDDYKAYGVDAGLNYAW